jgi:hypothetical protein
MSNNVVNLHKLPVDLNSDVGQAFVVDATRAGEGLITDKELSEKYELSPKDWQAIKKDRALERAIRAERERRVRTGQAAKEAASKHLVKGVGIVDQIMSSTDTHPKHKLDAFRELRQTASVGPDAEGRQDSTRFIIRIDLTADISGAAVVETYNKSIAIDPNDTDPGIKIGLSHSHIEHSRNERHDDE